MSKESVRVGSRRQLLFDDFWFDSQTSIQLSMHHPKLREVALESDRPWEGAGIACPCVQLDGDRYRMWYRALHELPDNWHNMKYWQCYAESSDGIHWEKPNLGLVSFGGSRKNNILFPSTDLGRNISVIVDANAPPDERYKMITRPEVTPAEREIVDPERREFLGTIRAYVSSDGLRWRPVETNPILTKGPFDSPNTLLWDDERGRYVIYLRGVDKSIPGPFQGGRRAIRRSESEDFLHWTEPELVVAPDEDDPENLHIYTNAAVKYDRAARAYFMFPMVLYPDRHYPGAPNPGLSNIIFATSRDGVCWERRFRKPFIAPGLDERNWVDRNPTMGQGLVPTGPTALSMYYSELNRSSDERFRRATIRPDGFVSIEGPYTGWGEFTTRPITFTGRRVELNYSTSGGGSILVELQGEDGRALSGFNLEACDEIFGDKIAGTVNWQSKSDVGGLAGQPVRLRVRMRDAHLYAFRFAA